MSRAIGAGVLVAALAGCAAKGPTPEMAARLADADAEVRQGCYRCLERAVALLTPVTARSSTPAPRATEALFEATLLLALRQRELGIDSAAAFAAARDAGQQLASRTTAPVTPGVLWELADTVTADASATMLGARTLPYPQWRGRVAALLKATAPLVPASRLASYVSVSAVCEDRELAGTLDRSAIVAAHPAMPLLTYRLATCGANIDDHVDALHRAEPRWFEAAWFLGRRQLATTRNVRAAAALFAEAAQGLPEAPAVLLSLAGAQQALRQLEPALATYDRLLVLAPENRPGLLGRVLCLTYLKRHDEAVSTASRMIELGTYLMADAHYWRAWNRYQLRDLTGAEGDAELALTLMANTNAFTLAGVIQYDLKRPTEAESRFVKARELDATNCQAPWYLGLIHSERPDWKAGASDFETATRCFTQAAAQARAELAALDRSTEPPETRAAAAGEHQAAIAAHELRAAQSAYNAAHCLVRAGDRGRAEIYLAMAAEHPELKAEAERLRATLK